MDRLTQLHRARQLALRQATEAQLERIWPALDWARLDATYPRFAAEVAVLVRQNRLTSSGLTAAYLRAYRRAQGVAGEARPILAPALLVDQFNASLRSTSVVVAKQAASRGVSGDVAMANALTQVQGSMSRMVLSAGRDTFMNTIESDTKAVGWQRVLGGGGCDFCKMLAGRGAVYTQASVTFRAHDHCGCTAEPVYG
jgi:hypothetical protein